MTLNPMPFRIILFFTIIFLASCGLQTRLFTAEQILTLAKQKADEERKTIAIAQQKANEKLNSGETDPSIKQDLDNVLVKLNANLDSIQTRINVLENLLKNKSNFRDAKYFTEVAPYIAKLDSFNLIKQKRELVYQLVNESIDTKAFNLFKLGAFFDPGVYTIPTSAQSKIAAMFSPALDSIAQFSNKYSNVPRVARLVFVGYADESPIAAGGTLYNQLSKYTTQPEPSREELNRVLSQLRANEMMRHMRLLVTEKAGNFELLNKLRFNYFNYGRGEALPSPKITDYQKDDERRRIVMFYWSVLPELSYLN